MEDGFRLGQWLGKMRQDVEENRVGENVVKHFESVCAHAHRHAMDGNFDYVLKAFKSYKAKTGVSYIPKKHREHGLPLGSRASKQRDLHGKGRLSQEHYAPLSEAGFAFHTTLRTLIIVPPPNEPPAVNLMNHGRNT